ncbi:MAG: hypothetical protein IPH62_13825 [Ignavibacteriae bacterium]|nr:hypothetical protein [Ignavibacteriota bacterium]
MLKNKLNISIVIMFLSFPIILIGQNNNASYNIYTNLSFGYSYFASTISSKKLNRFQPNAAIKIMWQPEHLLSVGIESGYFLLYTLEKDDFVDEEFGTTNVKVNMSAIPLFLAFSMKIYENIELNGGIGGYLILTNVDAFDNKIISTGWSTGYQLGINYLFPFSEKLNFGTELKTYYLSKLESASIGINIFVKYALITY